MSRRSSTRPVSLTEVHSDGPLAGEPVPVPEVRAPDPRKVKPGGGMPLTRAAKLRVMKGAAVPFQTEPLPDEIPHEGTPGKQQQQRQGSVLPVVAASRSIARTEDEWTDLVNQGQVLTPPYDPWLLVCAVEESDALPELIDIMATNLTGFGFDLMPLFPSRDEETGEPIDPPPEAQAEREDLELFLASANLELGLIGLLMITDKDTETTGNGYLEVLRDRTGKVAAFDHLPTWTMRLGKLSNPVLVDVPFRHPTTGELVTLRRWRRFRTFVQVREQRIAYFKCYGDPRVINRSTGQFRESGTWGEDENGNSLDGTEVVHRPIYAVHSAYGVPRWVGASPHVRSSRSAAELINSWFNDAPIGAKVAMVAGGTWTRDSYETAVDTIDHMARGEENAWSLVALEAEAEGGGGDLLDGSTARAPTMSLEDLAYELPSELYSGDGNLIDGGFRRIARMFRFPPVYWGGSDDYSRAAVNTARATTEEQVFVPERNFRWLQWFNAQLLPSMGVNYWKLGLHGANTSEDGDTELGEITQGGGASPNALIRLFNEQTGQDEPLIVEPWGDRPMALTSILVNAGIDPNLPLADAMGAAADAKLDADGLPLPGADGLPAGDAPAQDTALNGAQVTAALAIVQEAVAGGITIGMAEAMLVEFFNLSQEAAQAILADADKVEAPEPDPVPGAFPGALDEENDAVTDDQVPVGKARARKMAPRTVHRLDRLAEQLAQELEATNPDWFA